MSAIESAEDQEESLVKTVARVAAVDGHGTATLVAERRSACESCAAKSGCGVSSLSGVLGKRTLTFVIPHTPEGTQVGDDYVIAMPQSLLLKIALMTYMIPILAMIAAAVFTAGLGGSDVVAAVASGGGLLGGFAIARLMVNRPSIIEEARPTLLHAVAQDEREGLGCND